MSKILRLYGADSYNLKKSARLTNSLNKTAYKSFNECGGITFEDILSNYPKEMIDKVWLNLSNFITENYLSGKGTFIKGFGTFTFSNIEYSLEGTTNQYFRDIKRRRPVFIASKEFIDYIKPGIYTEKSGMMYYTQKDTNNVSIIKVNYAKISYGANISKEECMTIINSIIKNMSDQIRRGNFKSKIMPGLGTFLIRANIFGMKFDNKLFEDSSLKTQKLYHTKKNLRFYMITKDSEGISHRNITDVDKAEREIRPKISVLTQITPSGDNWLQENMGINVKTDVPDIKRDDLLLTEPRKKNEYYLDQRFYKPYPMQDLYGLKISQDILEAIYKNKSLLLRAMKQVDRHGDGLIPKYDFINVFHKMNCHHSLRIEMIEDIVNLYINNDPNVIMIQYNNLINVLCKDIKKIIDNEYNNFPINKYRYSISVDNKREISANKFSRDTGNLSPLAISSVNKFSKLRNVPESEIYSDINKISKIINYLNYNSKKVISFMELISILQSYMISIPKKQMIKLLKYLDIKNPNAFYLGEFIIKLNKKSMGSTSINFHPVRNNNNNNSSSIINNFETLTESNKNNDLLRSMSNKNTDETYKCCKTSIDCSNSNKLTKKSNLNVDNNVIIDAKLIKIIKNKIFENSSRIDNISEYFDHLLSYNICRSENIIYPDELERLFQLEKFNFSIDEIKNIFNFIDIKKDGYIDRIEFIQSIRNVPHPLSTMINYMMNKKLSISDIAYKMDYDFYSLPVDSILNTQLDKLLFQVKIKAVNENFDNEFIKGLFDSISGGSLKVPLYKIFNILNYNNDNSYKHLSEIKNEVLENCLNVIPNCVSFTELKDAFISYDKSIKGKIPFENFMNIIKKFLSGKLSDQKIIHLLRIKKYIDNKNYVDYRSFLLFIFIDCKDDTWVKCLNAFKKFLNKECNDDLFVFIVKINNFCNNIDIKRTVELDRLYRFFSGKINCPLDMAIIKKFDYNKDGIVSMDDLKNVVIKYIDAHFFENKKQMDNEKICDETKNKYNLNKKLFVIIKEILNTNDMTEDNLFYYLDMNKDGFLDYNEFNIKLSALLSNANQTFNENQLKSFFDYLDEYSKGKVDLITFRNKLRIFNDDIIKHHENGYRGNSTIENLILTELTKWYKKNNNLSDTELFPILDHDHDGKISINDIKYFAKYILFLPVNELSDEKILHFIEAVSLNKLNNLLLADVQVLMKNIKNNEIKNYLNNIHNYCNQGICEENKDISWLNDVVDKIGMFINENYENNIEQFYNDYNTTNFRNEGRGLSFDNFVNFLECNHNLLESYYIKKTQQLILFKHISQNNKFITLDMLKKLFKNQKKYDFYTTMHHNIDKFIHENFPTCEDAFKFFHSVKTKNQETPTYNDFQSSNTFITKKEFFAGLNRMFPNKYKTNTLIRYYRKYFNKNSEKIKFSEFNYIYYSKINFDRTFSHSLNKDSKILTTRPNIKGIPFMTFNSPFKVKEHEKFETPYNLDPLEKVKRLILSSKINFKKEFKEIIEKSGNGMQNQFEFRNTIKKLDLGLTNIEIEDIIHKSGLNNDGLINLVDFYKYITEENKNLVISKKHVLEQIKEIKQLIYKYYTNPRLAFELNDIGIKGKIDFDKFKKIVYDIYARENKQVPSYSVMKYVYDYIDVRKDGVIDLNEWNKIFAKAEGKLDITEAKPSQIKILREWETSNDIIEIYKLISKNRKLIKDKVKLFTLNNQSMLIKTENMIEVLKNVLNKIRLSQTQWKMIVSIGDKDKSGMIDFNTFLSVIETSSKMATSHPV